MENLEKFELENAWVILGEENFAASDFALADSPLAKRLENIIPDNPVYFYDQSAQYRTRNACTLYMWIKMISDLWNYKFSIEEILDICDLAEKKYWWSEENWNYLSKSIDCVRHWWNNKFPEKEIVSYIVSLASDEFDILSKSWKTLGVGYKTSLEYFQDSQDNGKIDSESFARAKNRWGHAVSFNNWKIFDNYNWKKKFNIYENLKVKKLSKEYTFFANAYVFFKKEEILEKINLKNAKIAYKLGLWNWQNAKIPMSREEVMAVFINWLKKIASSELTIKKIEEIEKELL